MYRIQSNGIGQQSIAPWRNKKHIATLKRIFDLGKPKITFGTNGFECRIAAESAEVMKVIIRQYL